MEEQLFPLSDLEPAYKKAVWLYLYRDFSDSDRDRAEERAAMRFGFSSYPQHKLVNPETLEIVGDTGRSVERFLSAVNTARVKVRKTSAAPSRLASADERARALEKLAGSGDKPSKKALKAAAEALEDDDVVVRIRALQILSKGSPESVTPHAESLLETPNDLLRYAVCNALATTGDETAATPLQALVEKPTGTLNPNVLRMHAVKALARCGDAKSVDVLAPLADRTQFRNSTTRTVVTTLVAIATRQKGAAAKSTVKAVRGLLTGTYPDAQDDERMQRIALALAKHVHKALGELTGKKVKFPGDYDAKAVERLRSAWD